MLDWTDVLFFTNIVTNWSVPIWKTLNVCFFKNNDFAERNYHDSISYQKSLLVWTKFDW